jgi:adenosylmethionine-8-amino-7-oxononanoate aminotransferase/glycine/serine hydroxymethyltransferase
MIPDLIRRMQVVDTRRTRSVNLIASENRMSPLARRALASDAASRYFFDGPGRTAFPGGAEYAEVQSEGENLLRRLGRAKHVNIRPHSGLHAMTVAIAALTNPGDMIVSLAPASGGHYATGPLSLRLGRRHMTFALTRDQLVCGETLATCLAHTLPRLLYIDQCHGLLPIDLRRVVEVARAASPHTVVHADVSHGLGLVFGGVIENPLAAGCNSYGGSTHKTFPGPQKGVLLTDDDDLARQIAAAQYDLISNHHLNAALSLSVALWEFIECGGSAYASQIPTTATCLGRALSECGILPFQIGGRHSGWHQLWIPDNQLPGGARAAGARLAEAGIMVNVLPDLPGLEPAALRLGVSEICHLGFGEGATIQLGALIAEVLKGAVSPERSRSRVTELLAQASCPYDYTLDECLLQELPNPRGPGALCVPWSSVNQQSELPVFIAGRGVYVRDRTGRTYLDAKSGALNATLGYGREDIADVARDQLVRLMHCDAVGALNVPALALAQRIADLSNLRFTHTLFCNSGSEAAEAAMKVALIYQRSIGKPQRRRIVSLENSYHGCTTGALALTQLDFPKAGLDWLPSGVAISLPAPGPRDAELSLFQALFDGPAGSEIAAVILEPVQGIGGIHPITDVHLAGLRRLCDQHDVLLIFDEVLTGFGRTGRMFAYEHSGEAPDILMTSKGLTAGYAPLSAVSMTDRVFRGLVKDPHLAGIRHGHTMSGNATACAIAVRVLDILKSEDICGNAQRMGDRLLRRLTSLESLPEVVEVRGRGLLVGVDFASDALASSVVDNCRRLGLLVRAQVGVVQVIPPLNISEAETDRIAELLESGIRYALSANRI